MENQLCLVAINSIIPTHIGIYNTNSTNRSNRLDSHLVPTILLKSLAKFKNCRSVVLQEAHLEDRTQMLSKWTAVADINNNRTNLKHTPEVNRIQTSTHPCHLEETTGALSQWMKCQWPILGNSNKMRLKILNKILTKIRSNNLLVETKGRTTQTQ